MNVALFPELVVNGETIPQSAVAAETQHHSAPKGKPGIAWRKAAKALVVRTVLLQEARRRDLTAEPAEVGPGRFETDEEALIRGLLEADVVVPEPGDDAVLAEWSRDPSRFRSPPLWEVSHILCACDPRDQAAKAKARTRAVVIAAQAVKDPRSFARLAAENSDCGSKSSGGALGQLNPGETVPEFETVLHGLDEGAITPDPVLTRYGFHIIKMDAVAKGAPLPYDTVRPKIVEAMEKAAWTREAKGVVDRLLSSAQIIGVDLTAT